MATRFTNPFARFFTDNAALLSGGKLYFYESGSSTPKDTYSDNARTTANANPVILDSSGVMPDIFLSGSYRVVMQNSDGVQQAEADDYNAGGGDAEAWSDWDSGIDYDSGAAIIVTGSDGNYYRSILTPNLGNDPTSSPTFWQRMYFIFEDDAVMGGPLDGNDNTVKKINLLDYGEVTNAIGATGGGTQDIDLTLGNSVTATVDTSANTFTFSNPTATDELCGFTLYLTNGGSQTVNWPASVDWASASAPILTVAGVDALVFQTVDGGTIWNGFVAGLNMS